MSKRKGKRFEKEEEEDDDESYEPTDSDDNLSDSDKILLEKATKGNKRYYEENEEEVFGVGGGDSSDEDKVSDSDIEGKGDDDDELPNAKAWGRKKRDYYHTDYVDQGYLGYDEKDMEKAQLEEEEARAIQKRLIEQLDDADFSLDMFSKKPAEKEPEIQETIKTDLGKMSKRQKLALLQKESPEFFGLVEDFKTHMKELEDRLDPLLKAVKEGRVPESPVDQYVRTKYHLILNYCTNIVFYLLLKAKRVPIKTHPVVRRLFQFRQLLKQLEPVEEVVLPQIDIVLEKLRAGEEISVAKKDNSSKKSKKKMLKLMSDLNEEKETKKQKEAEGVEPPVEVDVKSMIRAEDSNEEPSEEDEEVNEEGDKEKEERRAITYQISKNKGLTAYRKKENRNPRVKNRNKFRKAQIRRKGQVREPKKELKKYGGEHSGIKIGVVKSIKLK